MERSIFIDIFPPHYICHYYYYYYYYYYYWYYYTAMTFLLPPSFFFFFPSLFSAPYNLVVFLSISLTGTFHHHHQQQQQQLQTWKCNQFFYFKLHFNAKLSRNCRDRIIYATVLPFQTFSQYYLSNGTIVCIGKEGVYNYRLFCKTQKHVLKTPFYLMRHNHNHNNYNRQHHHHHHHH